MNRRLFPVLALFLAAGSVYAEKIDMNGDFEKCKPDSNGIILPEGWQINKGCTKKSESRIVKETDEIRGGKFALYIENEPGGTAFLMKVQSVKVKPGDRVQCSIWAKGKGKIALGFITNGGEKYNVFLGTSAGPLKPVDRKNTWTQTANTYTVAEIKKNGDLYSKFAIIPVIYVQDNAELYLDDYTLEIIRAKEKGNN